MLTLVTMHSGIKSSIPPVHYVTMMDIWIVCCNAMVFGAMCEFVVVKYLHWRQQQKRKDKENSLEHKNEENFYKIVQQVQANILLNGKINSEFHELNQYHQQHQGIKRNVPASAFARLAWGKLEHGKKIAQEDMLKSIIVESASVAGMDNFTGIKGQSWSMDKPNGDVDVKVVSIPLWRALDKACRGVFPVLFGIFNGVYWPLLLCGSQTQEYHSTAF